MFNHILEIISKKKDSDIVIIGKGKSIDEIDLSLLKNYIIINTNDSEAIIEGDICVYNRDFVIDFLKSHEPRCKLYISNYDFPKNNLDIFYKIDYVPYSPDNNDFWIERFFSEEILIENSILITALKIANKISKSLGINKNVYLLGFDFSVDDGYSSKISNINYNYDLKYSDKLLKIQEDLLKTLFKKTNLLNCEIKHIGNKNYSFYSTDTFNRLKNVIQNETNLSNKFNVKIVAEITTNHFGDLDRLKLMIKASKLAGADYIKLQKRNVLKFYSEEELNKSYSSPFGDTFKDYRLGLELSEKDFKIIDEYCKEIGIDWFVSVLDLDSFQFISQFNPTIIKLPSTISEHKEFLKKVALNFKETIVISTGYTDSEYEKFILENFKHQKKIYLLQCVSSYPTSIEDTNIGVVRHYHDISSKYTNIIPGYSSHDLDNMCSMLAVAAGALMIEKHVKFGTVSWSHFDEVALDLSTNEFSEFVKSIRKAEIILGKTNKQIVKSEHHKYWKK